MFYTVNDESDLSKAGWWKKNSGKRTHSVGGGTPSIRHPVFARILTAEPTKGGRHEEGEEAESGSVAWVEPIPNPPSYRDKWRRRS